MARDLAVDKQHGSVWILGKARVDADGYYVYQSNSGFTEWKSVSDAAGLPGVAHVTGGQISVSS